MPDTNLGYSMMKKHLFSFIIAFAAMALFMVSCKDVKYKAITEMVNKQCPQSMGMAGDFTGVDFKDGNLIFNFRMNEELTNIDALVQNPQMVKKSVANMFQDSSEGMQALKKIIEEDKIGLTFNYIGKESGKNVSITITYEDYIEAINMKSSPEEILQDLLDVTNAGCPMQIETGLTMAEVKIEGDYVVYYYDADENIISIDLLNQNIDQVKLSSIAALRQGANDPSLATFLKACKNASKGLGYKYIGNDSKKECMFTIELTDLGI